MEPKAQIVYRKLEELRKHPNNPRKIKKRDFERLKESLQNNPELFEARPIILSNRTGEMVILAGNMRYEAATALGINPVPTVLLEGLDEEKEREIMIRDNISNGDWDFDELLNDWNADILAEWGLNIGTKLGLDELDISDESVLPQAYNPNPVETFEDGLAKTIPEPERYAQLEQMIKQCENEELKKTLQERLHDFKLFNFDYIANYYLGGATKEEREMIEAFGLVIPTEKRALELGYLDAERTVTLKGR